MADEVLSRCSAAADAADPGPTARRRRRTQAERREETQRKILEVAVAVLRSKGYAGLSTVEVAERAGVSRGALTHHYPSRELLAAGALQDEFGRAANKALTRTLAASTVDQVLKALLEDCQEFYFGGFFRIAIELATASGPDSGMAARVQEISGNTRAVVEAAWTKALVNAGVRPQAAEDVIWMTASMVRGLAVRKLIKDEPARFRRLIALWRTMAAGLLESEQD